MPKRSAQSTWRLIDWIIVPIHHPEYGRLLLWSLRLSLQLQLLSLAVTIVAPFATPSLAMLLHRWFDWLRADFAEFKRAVRAPKRIVARQESVAVTEYENPWV